MMEDAGTPPAWCAAAHCVMTSALGFTHGDAAARLSTRHMVALHADVAAALLSREQEKEEEVEADEKSDLRRAAACCWDVGAATGAATAELARLFELVVATDASKRV